jgi:hypothetical protein
MIAPVFEPLKAGGYPIDKFPMLQHQSFTPWNIHHINLDRMPLLDIQNRQKLQWLVLHLVLQFSDRERYEDRIPRQNRGLLCLLKNSFGSWIQDYTGLRQGSMSVFGLYEPSYGCHTMIMVGGMRLDLAAATVVLDAAVLPISKSNKKDLATGLDNLSKKAKGMMRFVTEPKELAALKQLIPAFVERCRTWSHQPNCEYVSTGNVPLSLDVECNPLCTCGQGVGFTGPEWDIPAWKGLLPYATRAALSPLFAVSYLELVAGPALRQKPVDKSTLNEGPSDACWACRKGGVRLMACAKCKKARYCSAECQKKSWKEHKKVCKAV